jgi:membrane dipeptidase
MKPGTFDFGLSPEQEERAARLHKTCTVVDGICFHPGGSNIYDNEIDPAIIHEAFPNMPKAGSIVGGVYAPYYLAAENGDDTIRRWWLESGVDVGGDFLANTRQAELAGDMAKRVQGWIDGLDWISCVTTAAEIRENKANGVVSLWAFEQPTFGISNDITSIDRGYATGVRTLMLTYNRADYVGQGCTERFDGGLSMYGLNVVKRCNDLGIIVDTSHCGRQTTLDACRFSEAPVLANHTSAQTVFDHARAKSDEEFRAIADTGGVIGVYALPFFLGTGTVTIEATLDHIDYIIGLVGIDHVGIGTDGPFQGPIEYMQATFGAMLEELGFRPEDGADVDATLVGFDDYRDMPNITRGLVARGYTDEEIAKILGENLLRVYEAVCS